MQNGRPSNDAWQHALSWAAVTVFRFEAAHPQDCAALNSNHSRDGIIAAGPSHNGCCHHNPRANDPINAGDRASLFEVNPTGTVHFLTNSEMGISEITYCVEHIYQTEQVAMWAWRDSVKIPVRPRLTEPAGRNGQIWLAPRAVPTAPSMKMLQEIVRVD